MTPSQSDVDGNVSLAGVRRIAYVKNGDVVLQLERLAGQSPDAGPDAFLADLLGRLDGADTLLLSRDRRNASFHQENLKARVLDAFLDRGPVHKLLGKTRSFAVMFRELMAFRPEFLVCGCLGPPLWASYLAARLCGAKFIHSRHVDTANAPVSALFQLAPSMNNWAVRHANALVCHGPYTYSQLASLGFPPDRIFEFDVACLAPENEIVLPYDVVEKVRGKKVILYVGRIHPDKGVLDLFDAAVELLKADPQLRLVFVGGGPALANLRSMIAEQQLEESVVLVGQVPHTEIFGYMQAASVTVTPTRKAQEGRCLTAMESMVCGTPVIAPDGGPFPFLVADRENGLLYETDSTADLAKSLLQFFADTKLQQTLSAGALRSGQSLGVPELTFGAAIARAIQVVEEAAA